MVLFSLCAAVFLPLLLVHSIHLVFLVYIITFLGFALGQFAGPAESAILPELIGRERLVKANGLLTVSGSLVSLLGPALGGLILGAAGFSTVVIVDVITFLIAALLIALIRTEKINNPLLNSNPKANHKILAPWHDWLAGLRFVSRELNVRLIFLFTAIAMLADGILNSLWAVWVKRELNATPFQFGLLGTVLGIGILLGCSLRTDWKCT